MKRRNFLRNLTLGVPAMYLPTSAVNLSEFTGAFNPPGTYKANWGSLAQYQTPDWFRDAKFGIWAHWGPQCEPENGDWYARKMYIEGSDDYNFHVNKYGHPSKFGFKDVINEWKADQWNPDELLALYKKAGAKYFFALANHHDNFDLYNSRYHSWNSLNVGPRKDIIGGWAQAAKKQGLRFGASVHAAHAWTWYETAQGSDKSGKYQGVPYDGKLKKADGKGQWWQNLDPQELYVQRHQLSERSDNTENIHQQWDWGNGANIPDKAYCNLFLKRTLDLIDKYQPDLLYFDDTALPLWPVDNAGLDIAAHFYNSKTVNKKTDVVLFGKILTEEQRRCMVWDIERGQSNNIEPLPWQTDTCIGSWHYDRRIYNNHKYKSAKTVIHTLIDVVSKNGNLLLSVPVRGNGTIDEQERAIVEEISEWMAVNQEGIFGTRPWKVFGEGPAIKTVAKLTAQGFNEGKGKPLTPHDFRFTVKGNCIYVFNFGWPENGKITIKSLRDGGLTDKNIVRAELLGGGEVTFRKDEDGLSIVFPDNRPQLTYANTIKLFLS